MLRVSTADRRARLAVRHRLTPASRAAAVADVVRDLVCLHATDPATVYLSALARMKSPSLAAVDNALYIDKTLVRMLAMRRTMFVFPVGDAPVFHAATTAALARTERRRNLQLATMGGIKNPKAWLLRAERDALAVLEARGELTAQELAREVPALGKKILVNQGKKYEGYMSMASRILLILAIDGQVVRARPRGTWLSSQYRWAPMSRWLGTAMPDLAEDEARATVVTRWLDRFGPGTENDLRWWTGWTAGQVRKALAQAKAVEVELEGGHTGYLRPDDDQPARNVKPWVALLPALDPTTMGWKDRDWYLGGHKAQLFDSNGNAGPTVWADGRIVGGWAVRANGEVVTRLLEDIGREQTRMVAAESARLERWLDPGPVMPRFPTPLHRELARG